MKLISLPSDISPAPTSAIAFNGIKNARNPTTRTKAGTRLRAKIVDYKRELEIGNDIAVVLVGEISQDLSIDRIGQRMDAPVAKDELANTGVPATEVFHVREVVGVVVIGAQGQRIVSAGGTTDILQSVAVED